MVYSGHKVRLNALSSNLLQHCSTQTNKHSLVQTPSIHVLHHNYYYFCCTYTIITEFKKLQLRIALFTHVTMHQLYWPTGHCQVQKYNVEIIDLGFFGVHVRKLSHTYCPVIFLFYNQALQFCWFALFHVQETIMNGVGNKRKEKTRKLVFSWCCLNHIHTSCLKSLNIINV